MRDMHDRLREERHLLGDLARALEHRVRDERADAQAAIAAFDRRELTQAGDIDQQLGRGEPHVERRDEALAAGEDLRARPLDELERLGQRSRLGVGE